VAAPIGDDESEQGPVGSTTSPLQTPDGQSLCTELIAAADKLLAARQEMNPRPRKDRSLAIATFAAYEAKRDLAPRDNFLIRWLYRLFLIATLASPLFVALTPTEQHSVVWDGVGLFSTMLLLYLTYGVYTFRMVRRASFAVGELMSDPAKWTASLGDSLSGTDGSEGGDRLEAMVAVILLIVGSYLFWCAVMDLLQLGEAAHQMHAHASAHLEELVRVPQHIDANSGAVNEMKQVVLLSEYRATYASIYCWYFVNIWLLSGLFIMMDGSVAAFNASHSESYIAASSAAFVTFPMFVGISLVGVYLSAEYLLAWYDGSPAPVTTLSVEFASGALTFQMMLSNIIFVIMNKNWVFRLFYNAVQSSWKP
jgi:hypothetical protein